MAAGEEVILAADSCRADNIFHEVVVDLYISINQKQVHVLPAVEGVLDGFTDGAGGSNLGILDMKPLAQEVKGWFGFFEPQFGR